MPEGLRRIGDFPNLTRTVVERGWPEARLRFLDDVWS